MLMEKCRSWIKSDFLFIIRGNKTMYGIVKQHTSISPLRIAVKSIATMMFCLQTNIVQCGVGWFDRDNFYTVIMEYTSQEYFDMVVMYGQCGLSARATARAYAVRFPNRRHLGKSVILRTLHRLRETGRTDVDRKGIGGPRYARLPELEEQILDTLNNDPTLSLRQVARICDTNYSMAQGVCKDEKMHAYHYIRVQDLQPQDYPRRLEFCRWLVAQNDEDPDFSRKILFSDESTFGREDTFNYHNLHVWDFENPHAKSVGGFQVRFGVNLWAGMRGDKLFGPTELPRRLNGANYRDFLMETLPQLIEDADLVLEDIWFQHDGAPAHNARQARDVLDVAFPERWIGRGGAVAWPPRSPDLNMLDYFLWGLFKDCVYRGEINNIEDLRAAIHEAIVTVTPAMLERAQDNLIRRARLCIEQEGGHFEHLL